ncbi:hypothetical protein B0T19DRAFT_405327 [Cercophora scortea]|uniref:Uncharacterized protein n=1 Tax=Cercophora scortea TaxID=314031 RepID=A0AAE0I4X2_9PEZI|nr:hypothetical protein B0T19DRAFT_405327 [Cercophora scortea]
MAGNNDDDDEMDRQHPRMEGIDLTPAYQQQFPGYSMTDDNIIDPGVNFGALDETVSGDTQPTSPFSGAGHTLAPPGTPSTPGFAFADVNAQSPMSPQYTPAHTPFQGVDFQANLAPFSPRQAHQPFNHFDPTAGQNGRGYEAFGLQAGPSMGSPSGSQHAPYMYMLDPNGPGSFQQAGPSAVISSPGSVSAKLEPGPAWSNEEEQRLLRLKHEGRRHKEIRRTLRDEFRFDRNENIISKKYKKLVERKVKTLGFERLRDTIVPLMKDVVVDELNKYIPRLDPQQQEAMGAVHQDALIELRRVTDQFGDDIVATLAKVVSQPKNAAA